MLNICVCDDERLMTKQLQEIIKEYFIKHQSEYSLTIYNSGITLFNAVKKSRADVIFLDIDLKDSHGIQVAKAIRQFDKKVKIVFITSYQNYKGAAFSVRAFGYVDKPVTKAQIYQQLTDIQKYIEEEANTDTYKFETTDGHVNIELKDILYFENENRKIKIVTFLKTYYMKQRITALSKMLESKNFYSPHVSFLINLEYVMDVKNYTVFMIEGNEIPLSQRKSTAFREAIDAYLAQTIRLCEEDKNV